MFFSYIVYLYYYALTLKLFLNNYWCSFSVYVYLEYSVNNPEQY